MTTVFLGTNNEGKIKEFKEMLANLDLQWQTPKSLNLNFEPEEQGDNFEDIALKKAMAWGQKHHLPTLVDDSGLYIDSLNGKPGIYSHRFFTGSGDDRNQHILKLMANIADDKRSARFICSLAFYDPQKEIKHVETGICEGKISLEIKGVHGFDYDHIFIPQGFNETFSELGMEIKNQMSHRRTALEKMIPFLTQWIKLSN